MRAARWALCARRLIRMPAARKITRPAASVRRPHSQRVQALGIETGADLRAQSMAFLQEHFAPSCRSISLAPPAGTTPSHAAGTPAPSIRTGPDRLSAEHCGHSVRLLPVLAGG